MAFQRGDVVLVPFPFSDLSAAKVRPAVVVSGVCTTQWNPIFFWLLLLQVAAAIGPLDYLLDDWRTAGLRYRSALKPVLYTFDSARVIYRVGALTPADLAQVDQRLRRVLEL